MDKLELTYFEFNFVVGFYLITGASLMLWGMFVDHSAPRVIGLILASFASMIILIRLFSHWKDIGR